MVDKSAPQQQAENNVGTVTTEQIDPKQGVVGNAQNVGGEGQSDPNQDIFAKLFSAVMDPFGQACEQQGVDIAIAIAMHADHKHPIVFVRGHEFDAASLAGKVLRNIQRQLLQELAGDRGEEDA